jgi:hypothetical protein
MSNYKSLQVKLKSIIQAGLSQVEGASLKKYMQVLQIRLDRFLTTFFCVYNDLPYHILLIFDVKLD